MADRRTLCESCGHTEAWHDAKEARRLLGREPYTERPCYREIGSDPCRCRGFRDSGEIAVRAGAGSFGNASPPARLVRNGVLTLLLVVMGVALLYAYRAQSPATVQIPVSQAIAELQAGQVRRVVVVAQTATIELRSGEHQQTVVAAQSDILTRAVAEYNAAHPAEQVELRYEQDGQTFSVIGSVLLSLLPVMLIGGFFFCMMRRSQRPPDGR